MSAGPRFGILGAGPDRVSRLGRMAIEKLLASGGHLAIWLTGGSETPLPWGLDDPRALAGLPSAVAAVPRSSATALAALAEAAPDFLLQVDDEPPSPELLRIPSLGIWRFASGGPGPLAFWALFDCLYHLEVRLDRVTDDLSRRVPLERRWIRLERHSYRQALDRLFEEMAEMPVYVSQCGPCTSTDFLHVPPASTDQPTGIDRARLRVKLLLRGFVRQLSAMFFSETWSVGVVEAPIASFADLDFLPSPRWLPSPSANRFLADPFLISWQDGLLLLAEDYDFASDRGRIVQEFSADGRFSGHMREALTLNCHMSYPFLLRHGDDLFCIPETHQRNKLSAWRWDSPTQTWKDPRQLLEGMACIDSTPVFFENLWWLFCTDQKNGPDHKLHVFFAPEPWGPWEPHPRNPVKSDIRSSRPAGTPFILRGQLYRPAQDSSKHYGWRLAINRVTCLTPAEFAEEPIHVLDSDRLGASGIHTLSGDGGWSVIDARHARFTPWRFPGVLLHKLRRLASFRA